MWFTVFKWVGCISVSVGVAYTLAGWVRKGVIDAVAGVWDQLDDLSRGQAALSTQLHILAEQSTLGHHIIASEGARTNEFVRTFLSELKRESSIHSQVTGVEDVEEPVPIDDLEALARLQDPRKE